METPSWPDNFSSSHQHAVKELLRGQESAMKLRDLFNALSRAPGGGDGDGDEDGEVALRPVYAEDLVVRVLKSFDNTLSLLTETDEVSQGPVKARVKSEEDSEESSKTSVPRDRRGCYKRRKTSDTRTRLDETLIDDGHQWRKYGQKAILNSNFPRNYFRCTHKIDQGCQATKQVQKIKDDPPLYRTVYQGDHTCKNHILKSPPLILDSPRRRDSSIIVSFNTSLTPKQDSSNPFASSALSLVKQEQKLPSDDDLTPRGDSGHDDQSNTTITTTTNNNNNQSESSDYYAVLESAGEISAPSSDQGDVMSSSHGFDMIVDSDFEDLLDIVEC